MSRRKGLKERRFSPSKYPFAFRQVLNHFERGADAKELVFDFGDENKAHQIRFTWYNFVRALRSHGYEKDTAIADGIIVKKREGRLVFSPRDSEPDFAMMERQMAEQLGADMPKAALPPGLEPQVLQAQQEMEEWLIGPNNKLKASTFVMEESGEWGGKPKTEKEIMDELFGGKEADPGA